MKEREKCKTKNNKKLAITDLNAPNGSRDILFQSQEFVQDGNRHFVGFQSHFHLNMTVLLVLSNVNLEPGRITLQAVGISRWKIAKSSWFEVESWASV